MVFLEELLLGKPIFRIRQKGVPPLLLPTSMLQLPRCLVRICNLFHKDNQLRISKFQKMQLQQEKQFSKTNLLRKCGLLAHTSAAFLKNCCTEKLFVCLRLVCCSLFLFHKHRKSGCSVSTGFQKLVEGTSALLFYFFRMLLLTPMQELLVNPQICI